MRVQGEVENDLIVGTKYATLRDGDLKWAAGCYRHVDIGVEAWRFVWPFVGGVLSFSFWYHLVLCCACEREGEGESCNSGLGYRGTSLISNRPPPRTAPGD